MILENVQNLSFKDSPILKLQENNKPLFSSVSPHALTSQGGGPIKRIFSFGTPTVYKQKYEIVNVLMKGANLKAEKDMFE